MMIEDTSAQINALHEHWKRLGGSSIRELFDTDPDRFASMSLQLDDLTFDYSKQHLDAPIVTALEELAKAARVDQYREALVSGEIVNQTENRPALHTALRNSSGNPICVDSQNVMPEVLNERDRFLEFADAVRSGDYQVSGGRVTDVVNIGIGGSDLGPKMVVNALAAFGDGPVCHFVSNVDGADLSDTLAKLDPATTIFIVSSKSFSTQETMTNAKLAFEKMESLAGENAGVHFCAVSTNLEATRGFGVPDERTFGFWDWVGGRYSVWSAIGLSAAIAIGTDAFQEFLEGASIADQHFCDAPYAQNIPVMMALLGFWNRSICGRHALAILPYDNRLSEFPRWLQQLDMESNGKSVRQDGSSCSVPTSPIIFGEPGTNGQHAFYQMLHQGSDIIPVDFLVAALGSDDALDGQHKLLLANCFAQSEALMRGRTSGEVGGNPHRVFEGNRPSNTLLYKRLDPKTLGMLMALYEHKIFVQGVIWGVNSFDQWGVELGKELANKLAPMIDTSTQGSDLKSSMSGLLKAASTLRKL